MSGVASVVQKILETPDTEPVTTKKAIVTDVRTINGFEIGGVLGKGGFSKVYAGFDKEKNKRVALKCMFHNPAVKSQTKQIDAEVAAMDKIKHKNVIRLYEYDRNAKFPEKDGSTKDTILVVLELATGGELFDYLMYTGKFSEKLTRSYFHQLIEGMEACHKVGVAHRDLKPENLLLDDKMVLKLADFGFASVFREGVGEDVKSQYMLTECGTRAYMAPEILAHKKYTESTDIWAAGIICFIMIAGFPPLQQATEQDWWFHKLKIKRHNLFWAAHTRTATFSESAKDFIVKMLCADPKERMSLDQIQQHPWYKEPIFNSEECAQELKRRKVEVDNAKAAEQREDQKKQSAHRAIGSDPDELPMTDPTMQSGKVMDALVDKTIGEWPDAPPRYNENIHVKTNTEFVSEDDPRAVMTRIVKLVKGLQGKAVVDRNSYTIEAEVNTQLGIIRFQVETMDMGKGLCLASFRRVSGNPLNYQKLYDDNLIKPLLDTILVE